MTGEPSRSKTKGKEQVDPAEQAETASVFARPKRRLLRVVSGDDLQQASPFTPTPKASQPAHGAGHDARAAADGSRAQELDAFEPLSSPEDFNKPSSKPLSLGVLAPKKVPAIARASRAALAAKGQELTRQLLQRRASSAGLKGPQASTNKALKVSSFFKANRGVKTASPSDFSAWAFFVLLYVLRRRMPASHAMNLLR